MITLSGVHKAFDGKQVLRGVDLHVAQGKALAIIGGSGAGKSVLMKTVLGLLEPDQGSVLVDGAPRSPAFMARVGMVFQGGALFDSLAVWQNVAFKHLRRMPKAAARQLAIDKLARVGLGPETADLYPADLSGGMQKRAALARAIAADPDVIFFDEPTTGLDPVMAGVIDRLIRDVVTDMGVTALTITHDLDTVAATADRVALLKDGTIRWQGTPADMAGSDNADLRHFMQGRSGAASQHGHTKDQIRD